MKNDTTYRPKFGYDIRIRPPRDEKAAPKTEGRVCEWPGCNAGAAHKAPKNRQDLGAYSWFCLQHVRDYNRNWNFFAGLSDAEAAALREKGGFGDRPTWAFGSLGSAGDGTRTYAPGAKGGPGTAWKRGRPFGSGGKARPEATRAPRPLTKRQIRAFDIFHLPHSASRETIRAQYKALVKRFHPDTNGGDRSFEARLREVIEAYQVLKTSGFC